jgi:hypothetical protein
MTMSQSDVIHEMMQIILRGIVGDEQSSLLMERSVRLVMTIQNSETNSSSGSSVFF